jgi:hypothetical protein
MNGDARQRHSRRIEFFDRTRRILQLIDCGFRNQFESCGAQSLEQSTQGRTLARRQLLEIRKRKRRHGDPSGGRDRFLDANDSLINRRGHADYPGLA